MLIMVSSSLEIGCNILHTFAIVLPIRGRARASNNVVSLLECVIAAEAYYIDNNLAVNLLLFSH